MNIYLLSATVIPLLAVGILVVLTLASLPPESVNTDD